MFKHLKIEIWKYTLSEGGQSARHRGYIFFHPKFSHSAAKWLPRRVSWATGA
jgi:hypothetical protein